MPATTRTTSRLKKKAIADLLPAPYNPRAITEQAMAGLSSSIARFGLVQPIIWNERTGHVVGGHQRLKALVAQGEEKTDVVVVDLPESEEKALNVALNSPAISGEFVQDDLDALLLDVKAAEPELFDDLQLEKLASLSLLEEDGETDDDAVPEAPDEAVSERGVVYCLGEHRLLCGDSTAPDDVALLLGGDEPFLMVTDPPYGVEYDPKWRNEAAEKGLISFAARREGSVSNDDRVDWSPAWALFPGDVAYVWHDSLFGGIVADALFASGFVVRSQIIWRKHTFAISLGHYHWQHESALYAVRKGRTARWGGDRSQSTVWDIPNVADEGASDHGTQKPVECMARPIRNHGAKGDGVYDPFVGSGTTIIACEKLDRRCYAMEIEPAYVDVCRKRWAEFVHGEGCDWEALTDGA